MGDESAGTLAATRAHPTPAAARARELTSFLAGHATAVVVIAASLVGLIVAVRARRFVLYDDAAITMRYASRIANGLGWTYNDHDQTNGASAPLYTMVLAAAHWIGSDLESAAKAIGALCYAATIGLVAYIAARITGPIAGGLAALLLLSSVDYRTQASSGMESAFAAVLGLAVIVCLLEGRENLAGVALGLGLVNKLDAGLLALAVAIVFVAIMRRPPWRIAAISAAVLAPWLVFSVAYFGSPLPYSMTQKLTVIGNPASQFTHSWILDALRVDGALPVALLALAALAALPMLMRDDRWRAVALAVCVAWPVLHGIVYSFVDLGDPYPWYRTVLYPPFAVAAACALAITVRAARGAARPTVIAVVAGATIVAAGATATDFGNLGTLARTVRHGHQVDEYEAFEATRRDAGRYIGRVAREGDVVATCFGWIAYGAIDQPIDETCPLNTRDPVPRPRWGVDGSFPGYETPELPRGAMVEKEFRSTLGAGGQMIVFSFPSDTSRG